MRIALVLALGSVVLYRPAIAQQPPEVVRVENANGHDGNVAHLTDRVLVSVANLESLKPDGKAATPVVLYLDGRALPNTKAALAGPAKDGVTVLAFDLRPNYNDAQEAETWRRILISARRAEPDQVALSVGTPEGGPISSRQPLKLKQPEPIYRLLVYAGILLVVIGVFVLARISDLIRTGPKPAQGRRRYSLGQTQMAIWFCLILFGWAYVSLMTMSSAHISASLLALMGISGATGLAAVAMDAVKSKAPLVRAEIQKLGNELDGDATGPGLRRQLAEARRAITVSVSGIPQFGAAAGPAVQPAATAVAGLQAEVAEKEARLQRLSGTAATPAVENESKGWIRDILSDEHGISLHRVQMFVWTVALGCYFVTTVFRNFVMPELDAQLLILMGISSGTYLGFKLPEAPRV